MSLPSPAQVDDLLAQLEVHVGGRKDTARRLRRLLDRDRRGGSAVPDGWPASTMGGGGGGPSITVEDEHGVTDRVAVTQVEAAVFARPMRDPVRVAAEGGAKALNDVVEAWQRLVNWVEQGERAQELGGPTEPGCWAMARIGVWEPVHVAKPRGVKDKPLGRWAYGFLLRFERIPTPDECRAWAEGRRVNLKAEEVARSNGTRRSAWALGYCRVEDAQLRVCQAEAAVGEAEAALVEAMERGEALREGLSA